MTSLISSSMFHKWRSIIDPPGVRSSSTYRPGTRIQPRATRPRRSKPSGSSNAKVPWSAQPRGARLERRLRLLPMWQDHMIPPCTTMRWPRARNLTRRSPPPTSTRTKISSARGRGRSTTKKSECGESRCIITTTCVTVCTPHAKPQARIVESESVRPSVGPLTFSLQVSIKPCIFGVDGSRETFLRCTQAYARYSTRPMQPPFEGFSAHSNSKNSMSIWSHPVGPLDDMPNPSPKGAAGRFPVHFDIFDHALERSRRFTESPSTRLRVAPQPFNLIQPHGWIFTTFLGLSRRLSLDAPRSRIF